MNRRLPARIHADLANLTHLLQQHAITTVTLPPSVLALLEPASLDEALGLAMASNRLMTQDAEDVAGPDA